MVTGEGEVAGIIRTAVLPGRDVIDVEGRQGDGRLWERTIFAAVPGPPADELPRRRVDQWWMPLARTFLAFRCKMPIRWMART